MYYERKYVESGLGGLKGVSHFEATSSIHRQHLYTIRYDSTTTFPLEVFTQRNFVADFIRINLNYIHKTTNLTFKPPFGELGVTYAPHLKLVEKRVVDFLFTIDEHFC